MGKGICRYAIPMKPPYQYPYGCMVMYGNKCSYEALCSLGGASCPKLEIGENEEQRRRVTRRHNDIWKAMEDPSAEEVVVQKHSALGKSDQMLEIIGVLTKEEVK